MRVTNMLISSQPIKYSSRLPPFPIATSEITCYTYVRKPERKNMAKVIKVGRMTTLIPPEEDNAPSSLRIEVLTDVGLAEINVHGNMEDVEAVAALISYIWSKEDGEEG